MIAWQQDPGSAGGPEIRLRYAPDGVNLNPDQVLSSPTLGPTNADLGLAAAGDQAGDAAVAWVQGSGAQTQIVTAQLYQAPGSFHPLSLPGYSTSVNPVLRWSAASEQWGSPTYQVKLDGVLVAQSTATAVTVPTPVRQGRHVWQVTAVNRAGVATVARSATVFVDSLPPIVSVRVSGQRHPLSPLRVYVRAHDTRPGLGRGQVSGAEHRPGQVGRRLQPVRPLRLGPRLPAARHLSAHRDRQGPGRQSDRDPQDDPRDAGRQEEEKGQAVSAAPFPPWRPDDEPDRHQTAPQSRFSDRRSGSARGGSDR